MYLIFFIGLFMKTMLIFLKCVPRVKTVNQLQLMLFWMYCKN